MNHTVSRNSYNFVFYFIFFYFVLFFVFQMEFSKVSCDLVFSSVTKIYCNHFVLEII